MPTPYEILGQTSVGGSGRGNIFFADTAANLGVSATFTGPTRGVGVNPGSTHGYAAFNAFAFSAQAGALRIEVSNDGVTWRRQSADQAVAANTSVTLSVPVVGAFYRAVYVNGAAAQTAFMLNTSFTES